MYLEISPRQSGKTERLIREAYDFSRNETCFIFVPTIDMKNLMVSRIEKLEFYYNGKNEKRKNKYEFNNISILCASTGVLCGASLSGKLFFDEFDHIPDTNFFSYIISSYDNQNNLFDNLYVATTPRYIRKIENVMSDRYGNHIDADPLIYFLKTNNWKYKRYNILRNINGFYDLSTPESADVSVREFNGIFMR